jgi:hypothetical protein
MPTFVLYDALHAAQFSRPCWVAGVVLWEVANVPREPVRLLFYEFVIKELLRSDRWRDTLENTF